MSQRTDENEQSQPDELPLGLQAPGGLATAVEAVLIVAAEPQTATHLAHILEVSVDEVEQVLLQLQQEYAGNIQFEEQEQTAHITRPRGFALRYHDGAWQLVNSAATQDIVAAFISGDRTAKLSTAASETLAIIAYQQPITRAKIAAIRGVNADGVVRSLLVRGLIEEQGMDEQSHAATLVTTNEFLERLGLHSLDDLPALAPFLPQSAQEEPKMEQGTLALSSV